MSVDPAAAAPPPQPAGGEGPPAAPTGRPEVLVGAAFVGGVVLALVLRRITS